MGKTFSAVLIVFALFCNLQSQDSYGQENFSGQGALALRERHAEVKPGGLISNVVRIVNTTGRNGEFTLRINAPAGWQVVGFVERNFSMQAGDTLFFPVRIIALSKIQRPDVQTVSVSLLQFRNVIASENWTVVPLLRSDWTASISDKQIILSSDADTASFRFDVINTGDLPEIFSLELTPGQGIHLINDRGEMIKNPVFRFRLDPLADTTLTYVMKFSEEKVSLSDRIISPANLPLRIRAELEAEPHSAKVPKSWNTNIDIKKLDHQWKENPSAFLTLPLTVSFNAFNVLDENAYGDLSLYGFYTFNPETSLSYYFQTNFVSNFLNPQTFLGQYLQINFQSKYFGVELGNVNHNIDGANVSGEGVRLYGKYRQHLLMTTVVQNPRIFQEDFHVRGLSAEYKFTERNVSAGAFFQLRENATQKTDEEIAGAKAFYRFLGSQMIRASVMASRQTHNWKPDSIFELPGLGYNVSYSGSLSRFNYSLLYANYSPTHVVRRGSENINARISRLLGPRHNVFGAFSQSSSDPEYYYQGELQQTLTSRFRQIYRLGYQYTGTFSDVSFQPTYQILDDRFIRHNFSGVEAEYRVKEFQDVKFFSSAMAGYTSLPEFNLDPFFTARLRAVVRYAQYALNIRYYYGPYYTNELLRFAESQVNTNRFGAGFDFDQNFLEGLFKLRVSSQYTFTTLNNQHSVSVRPELFYFPQSGLRFGIYGRYFGLSSEMEENIGIPDLDFEGTAYSSARYEFGFSIRKDINMPVSGRRYYDLTVVVYSDVSGTGSRQSNDPGLSDMWVRLQALEPAAGDGMTFSRNGVYETLTNRQGEALFINIPPGNYLATIVPVAQAGSRYEARTYEIVVSNDRTVYLSIDRGARVSGTIILDRDQYTRAEYFPISGIRVTATAEDGQKFNTLTSVSGQYNLFLPKGTYTLSINEEIFSDKFDLLQNNVPIEIRYENEVISVNFTARERSRQIRIQQPDQNNQTEPEEED